MVHLLLRKGAPVAAADAEGRTPLQLALLKRRFTAAARLVTAMQPAHADLARQVLRQCAGDVQAGVTLALAGMAAASQARAQQQQQEQLDRDRQQLAAERAAAQELLVAACFKLRQASAAACDDAIVAEAAQVVDDAD